VLHLTPPGDLFGLPLVLSRPRAVDLVADIEAAWAAQHGGAYPVDLASDLKVLAAFFDPLAREATLRRRLDELPESLTELPDALALDVGAGRRIVTPEGRVVLELLRELLRDLSSTTVAIETSHLAAAEATLADFYRGLARRRLDKVRALAAGEAAPMLPVAAGVVLLLLINRSTSKERALAQSAGDADQRAVIDSAFAPALRAFAETLTGEPFQGRDATGGGLSLYQGYAFTEARRRLGSRLRLEEQRLWIPEEDEHEVLAFVARDLKRRGGPDRALAAFDALVENYRATLPRVANLQFAHERPAHTTRIRRELERLLLDV
jgi:hypothetical protein